MSARSPSGLRHAMPVVVSQASSFGALALLLGLAACASDRCCDPCGRDVSSSAAPAMPAPTAPPGAATADASEKLPAPGTIIEQKSGRAIDFATLVPRLVEPSVAVVYVGEGHDQAAHHKFQAKVLEAVASQSKGPVALGMEMFYKPYQKVLDAYVAGEIDEKAMLEQTEWAKRWGFGWEMYAPMLRLCREKKIPVIALNAPKEITRAVSRGGLDSLTAEQKATLPPLDMTDAAHRAFVQHAFEGHGPGMKPEVFERFYTSMVIWDEVMSSGVADWLSKAGDGARMVVVAGNGHIADRYGIPARAARKTQKPYRSIVQEILHGEHGEHEGRRTDTTYADFTAWWTESAPPAPPKTAPKPAPKPAKPAAAPAAAPVAPAKT